MAVALMSCNSYVAPHVGLTADLGGLPRFSRVVELEEIPGPSANVSAGDLDGDGDLDIVLAKGRHWPQVNRVLMGDGTGQFTAGHDLGPVADRSYSGFLSDLDGDGDLDVIIGNDRPDTKRTYLSDGSGHFEPGSEYGQPEWPTRNASVADLNGDGLPDVVVANRGRPNSVCLNQGHARFSADCTAFSKESATTITPADLDGDGRTDLVVPNRDGGQSYVYLNDGAGGFSNDRRIPFGEIDVKFRMAAVADLDGDDLLDIVAIDERRGVSIYLRASDQSFVPHLHHRLDAATRRPGRRRSSARPTRASAGTAKATTSTPVTGATVLQRPLPWRVPLIVARVAAHLSVVVSVVAVGRPEGDPDCRQPAWSCRRL